MSELLLPPRFELAAVLSGVTPRVASALDRERGQNVVVKLAENASEEEFLSLRREFRLLASLDHPSIVKALDFGLALDGRAWFSMEEVVGPDLANFAKEHALLENLSALVDVAHALDYVHSRGFVHGDIKPTNVRISGERAFLLDFGLAVARGEEVSGIRGTPAYAAPEILLGGRPDRRADLYSLGITFYEAVTGVLPTAGRDLAGVLRFHLEEEVPLASSVKPGIPSRLDRILSHLLEKETGARYPSARRLLDDLGQEFGLVRGATFDARPELLTPPFVGRGELLSRFTQALHLAAEGLGRAILVTGPPGSGKTRLLSNWRALAQSEGALVFDGRAVAGDETPYRPILDLLSAMQRRVGDGPAKEALASVGRLAATRTADLPISRISDEGDRLRLFDELLLAFEATRRTGTGGHMEAVAPEAPSRPEEDVEIEALRRPERLKEKPLVILLDDLHLADRATAAFIGFLSKAVEAYRMILVGTLTTPSDSEAELSDPSTSGTFVAAGGSSSVPVPEFNVTPWLLGPFSEGELSAAASGALGESELPADFVRSLHADSHGLPGPLVRILEAYVEARVLSIAEGRLKIDEAKRARSLPTEGELDVVKRRLSALTDERRMLLAALSIVPTDLSYDLLRRLYESMAGGPAAPEDETRPGYSWDVLADDLAALKAEGLLVTRERQGEIVYEFPAPKTREFIAASLKFTDRQRLHDVAAAYFQSRLSERPNLLSAAATHALKGGDPELGIRLGLEAAAQAERLFAYDPAATFYAGVLAAFEDVGDEDARFAVWERLGDVHFRAGNWRRALSAYQTVLKHRTASHGPHGPHGYGPRSRETRRMAALLTFKIAMIRLRRGDAEAARELLDRAEVELADVGSKEEQARLLDASAGARLDRADAAGAEAKAQAGLALIGDAGPAELKSPLLGILGLVALSRGDYTSAEARLQEAVTFARASGRPELVRNALSALAKTLWKTGRRAESEKIESECLIEAERSRDPWGITASLTNLALIWCGRGDYVNARPNFEKALKIHRRLGAPAGQALTHLHLGQCDEVLGRWDEAETNYRLMLDLLAGDRSDKRVLTGRLALASLLRKRGDLDRAKKLLAETLPQARDGGDRLLHAASLLETALVERDRELFDDARRHLDEALDLWREAGRMAETRDGLFDILLASSELALRVGDLPRSQQDANRAGEIPEAAGASANGVALGRLKSLNARLAWVNRRFEEGDRLFQEGVRLLSDLSALYDLGWIYYEWGLVNDDRVKASARIGTAARLFDRVGARRGLDRARGALERIAHLVAAAADRKSEATGVIGLYEVSRIVNSTRDLQAVLDDTVDVALRRLNAERGMILLANPVTGRLEVRVARNLKTGKEEEAEALSRSVVERVVKEGQSILAADARIDPRFAGRESILAHSIVSFLCVPLRVKDRISGAIYIDHRGAPRLFSERDKAFLEAFADLAAVAIENARLVEELLEARQRLSVENESLKANLLRGWNLDALVGTSEAARRVKTALPRAAAGTGTVLIRGESGSGKNLVARILHALSPRSSGPFIQFNCAALPETLAESELFGHEKGSFTGADRKKPGRFELAQGGTIFLDEIGKTTLSIQSKLLRVVEDKEFERVGGTSTVRVDVKILAATNLDLEDAIVRGEFREDLFYRLNVVPIELPPLRKRMEDLPSLVQHFVRKLSRDLGTDPRRLDASVFSLFSHYPWPGNIRELEATLHRALVLSPNDTLTADDFTWIRESPRLSTTPVPHGPGAQSQTAAQPSASNQESSPPEPLTAESYEKAMAERERELLERALAESGGKLRDTARRLGLARNTLKAKMTKYGVGVAEEG